MVQVEFFPVNCPLLPRLLVNCPCHLLNQSFLSREGNVHLNAPTTSPPTPFMDEMLSEERQLIKWVGIFQVGIFWVGIFRRRNFPGGSLMGGNFPDGNFPGGNCPRIILLITDSQFPAFYKSSFFNSKIPQSRCIFLYDNVTYKLLCYNILYLFLFLSMTLHWKGSLLLTLQHFFHTYSNPNHSRLQFRRQFKEII